MAATATFSDDQIPARAGALRRAAAGLGARMNERALVKRLQRGDEAAFRELVKTHQERVLAVTTRMLGDRAEAEDLAQEIFVTVFQQIHRFRGDSRLSTWLYRIAYNHSINRLKLKSRRVRQRSVNYDELPEHAIPEPETPSAAMARPDHAVEAREAEAVLQKLLLGLSEQHRIIIVMRDLEGMSYEEIADVLEVAAGTVKSRLHRARAELARGYAAYQKGGPGRDRGGGRP